MCRLLRKILITAATLALLLPAAVGCRAIGRFHENQHSIAARGLSRQGLKAMHEEDWESAESLFADALKISRGDDEAHRGFAEALWRRERTRQAIAHMEQAVRLSANDPKHVQRLGEMYLDVGRVDDAMRQGVIALQAERQNAAAWVLRGDCLHAKADYPAALASYHRALSLQPDLQRAQLQAAEIYNHQGKFDRVLASMDRLEDATESKLVPARADMLRGLAMNELGRPIAARVHFAAAATKSPDDAEPHLMLARTALQTGEFETAREALASAIRIDPTISKDQELIAFFQRENAIASERVDDPESVGPLRR